MAKLTVKQWQERIKLGQRFQNKVAGTQDWARYKAYYRHGWRKQNIIPVNLYFSLLRSLVPQIYPRNPRVTITAKRPGLENELFARILQTLDNWLIREVLIKPNMKSMIESNFFTGIGCGVLGYDSQFGTDESNFDQTNQFSLTQFDSKGDRIEFYQGSKAGMPWFLNARSEDVVFPWGATSQHDLEWFALRVFRKVKDIKADKKYTNTKDLKGTFQPIRSNPDSGPIREVDGPQDNIMKQDEQFVELWEVHDARTRRVYGLTMDTDKFLRDDVDEMQIEGLPVETAVFNPDPDWIYGVPDGRIIEAQQLELNEIRTQAMRHRRLDILKGLIKEGAMEDTEIAKLTSEDVMALAKVKSEGDLRNAIAPLNFNASAILQDMAFAAQEVQSDVREMVGFPRTAQGQFQGKTHISATETRAVFQALNIRLDERRDVMADVMTRVIRKFNQMVFKYWTRNRVAQVVGPDGAKWWLEFNGPQIAGEYHTEVAPEEGATLDSQTKFDQAITAAETWAKLNAGQIQQGAPVPAEIQRMVFNTFEGSGLDIDRLLAQTGAIPSNQASPQQQALGGAGAAANQPVSPQLLAQLQQGGRSG